MNATTGTTNATAIRSETAETGSSDLTSRGLPMHTLYLGSRGGRGFNDEDISEVGELVAAEFGSFTMFPAVGFYRGKTLPSLVVKIGADDTDVVRSTARKLGHLLDQAAVGLELDGRYHRILT